MQAGYVSEGYRWKYSSTSNYQDMESVLEYHWKYSSTNNYQDMESVLEVELIGQRLVTY